MLIKVLVICLTLAAFQVNATDTRYCGEPKRYNDGRIIRSAAVIAEFESLYPLPKNLNKKDFQINHAVPLVCGGCDSVENLIWMHKKAKTCADDYCQDQHEQITMCPKNYHK
jgi:hypothetical protein